MKRKKKIFVASLFEDQNYITIYAEGKGEEVGRIWNENYGTRKRAVYIALLIASGTRGKFNTLQKAKNFIDDGKKTCFYGEITNESKKVLYYQLWLKNDFQRKLIGNYDTLIEAKREQEYTKEYDICPVYENKQQKYIFE